MTVTDQKQQPPISWADQPLVRCDSCGLESPWVQAFQRTYQSFRRDRLYSFCPICTAKRGERLGLGLILVFGLIALLIAFIAVRKPEDGPPWLFLNIVAFYVIVPLCLLPHEAGHVVAAWLLGGRVYGIIIGSGGTILERQLGGLNITLNLFPTVGLTLCAFPGNQCLRLRWCLFLLAGPIINVGLLLAGLMVVRSATLRDVWDHMLLFEMPREILFGPILVLANIFLLAINLWPHQISIGGSKIASDGLGLLNAVLMPEKTANDLRGSFFLLETNHLGTSSQYEQALRVCEQGLQQFPSHSSLRHLLPACHFLLRDYARARQLWLRLLAEASPDPEHRLIYLKNIVTVDLLIGDLHLLGEADAFSSEAFLCAPWDHRMYRGAVLIELGRIDEGVALIRAALPKAKTPVPKTWGHSYLALAAARKGQEEQCRSHLVEARRFDESCRVIEAVEKKMKGPEVA